MRLLPRDTSLNTVASALSLAAANYKPIPQLPTANQSTSIASSGQGRNALNSKGNSFQVQKTGSTTDWSATHKTSDWGVPQPSSFPSMLPTRPRAQMVASSPRPARSVLVTAPTPRIHA